MAQLEQEKFGDHDVFKEQVKNESQVIIGRRARRARRPLLWRLIHFLVVLSCTCYLFLKYVQWNAALEATYQRGHGRQLFGREAEKIFL